MPGLRGSRAEEVMGRVSRAEQVLGRVSRIGRGLEGGSKQVEKGEKKKGGGWEGAGERSKTTVMMKCHVELEG